MTKLFSSFLITSAVGAVLAIIITAVRPLTKKIFSAGWHYYMWLSVLLVMMIPLSVKLPNISTKTSIAAKTAASVVTVSENHKAETEFGEKGNNSEEITAIAEKIGNIASENSEKLAYIWFFTAAMLFVMKIFAYTLFRIKACRNSKIIFIPKLRNYTDRNVITRVSSELSSPLVTGIFKPVLYLPNAELTGEQTDNILAHEMTHVKRNDILYKWFMTVVKCVHWFNPIIYLVARQINIDCEVSCDLAVVKNMYNNGEISYIETILSLIQQKEKPFPLTTAMTGSKKTLKKRFYFIRNRKRIAGRTNVISVIISVILLISALLANGIIACAVQNGKTESTAVEFVWPTESRAVSERFGKRINPITGEEIVHNGIDIATPAGSSVFASTGGIVAEAGFDADMGNYVVVENGKVSVFYGHLSETSVGKGETVEQNAVIGKAGSSGKAVGTVLHFEILINGQAYNPELVLPESAVISESETPAKELETDFRADVSANQESVRKLSADVSSADATQNETSEQEPLFGFEQVLSPGANSNELPSVEIVQNDDSNLDLKKSYTVGQYSYKTGLIAEESGISCDDNGNISVYFDTNCENVVKISFCDSNTGNCVGDYEILAGNENVYTFSGFDSESTYDVSIQGRTESDWKIEGEYIIY